MSQGSIELQCYGKSFIVQTQSPMPLNAFSKRSNKLGLNVEQESSTYDI